MADWRMLPPEDLRILITLSSSLSIGDVFARTIDVNLLLTLRRLNV